jgi:hypothetical protein
MATGFQLSAPNEYRRGVVLGLTLAEVLVLLAFLLLMTMTALLLRHDHEQAELHRQLDRDAQIIHLVQQAVARQGVTVDDDRLANLIRNGAEADSLRSQLREARQRADAAAKAAADDQALVALLERVPGAASEQPAEKLARVIAQADKDRSLNAELTKQNSQLTQTIQGTSAKDANLTGQNNQMRIELARLHGNGGSGLPDCWAAPNGATQYMLKVDMHDDGVIVSDFEARPRPDDPAWHTLDSIARGQLMPLAAFMSDVAPLKARETADRCRYGIVVKDSTGGTNKPGYKRTMGSLWGVFQLHEVDN